MKITTVLFDLDGTLLPMDQDEFTQSYFALLTTKLAPLGYEPKQLINVVWAGTAAMVKNDGRCSNCDAFWKEFGRFYGEKADTDRESFDRFYENEFCGAKASCGFNPLAAESVRAIKGMGLRVALATNPIFPSVATESRIRWAGLNPNEFELYTSYENSSYCKPNPKYYIEVSGKLGVPPEECLMVGNDVSEDMIASSIGMKVFLITDCMINKNNKDISVYPNGDFNALIRYIKSITK